MTQNPENGALPAYSIKAGQAPTVVQARFLGEGDFCRCYLVNEQIVFRFAKHAEASAALDVEGCVLPRLAQYLPIPMPLPAFSGHADASGYALMGYDALPGVVLERQTLAQLPEERQDALLAQLADCMRQLHNLPLATIAACGVPQLHLLDQLRDSVARARHALWPRLTPSVAQYHDALLAEYLQVPELHSYRPALLHGDLSPDHVLADLAALRLTGIIDWGDACIGDPAWDLIYLLEDYGPHTLLRFLKHYAPKAAPLLMRKAQIYQQLNNVAYSLALLQAGDGAGLAEGLALLEAQASVEGTDTRG